MPDEPAHPRRRRRRAPDGEPWDDSEWVDVGADDRWTPTFAERSRALILLLVLAGVLLLVAAVASLGGEDDEAGTTTAGTTSSTPTSVPATTTTAAVLHPASLDGDPPPTDCVDDDRGAAPLRERTETSVLVLNGSYSSGLANDTTEDLEELGYGSMQPANADDVIPETLIEYLPGYCAEAVRLFLDLGLPTASVAPFDDGGRDVFLGRADLVVTMGRDAP